MSTAILLTGQPGCGKTTLIRRVIAELGCRAGGFYTQEIREEADRVGFKLVTLDGHTGILAHVQFPGPPRVGRYGVDLDALETVGVTSLRRALAGRELVVLDEIGPMEMFSPAFCRVVLEILDSDLAIFGSIVRRSKPFSDQIKTRPDVQVIEVTPANRETLAGRIIAMLRATGWCDEP